MSEAEKSVVKVESVQEVSKQSVQAHLSKTHSDYWKTRVFRQSYTRAGARYECPDYAVKIQFDGRRETFPLKTANKAQASGDAAKIYASLVANGWEPTLAEFKPEIVKERKAGTVGEVIVAASAEATVRPRSLAQYVGAFRQLAAEIAGIGGGKDRFAYRSPAYHEWLAKVDAVPLSDLTPDLVKAWRARRIAAKTDPRERRSAEVSANTTIRQAKALFGAKLIGSIRASVELPLVLPFEGVPVSKLKSRFRPEVSAEWLFNAGTADLAKDRPEEFKALVLCLLAGLRRAEADTLTWPQIDLEEGKVSVRTTEFFAPKSEDGEREIDLSPDAVALFRGFLAAPDKDPVFVLKGGLAKPSCRYQYYRADCAPFRTWQKLTAWLSSKGVHARKAVHTLRKQAGALIHQWHGIEAARAFLGHSDIATTSDFYVGRKPKTTVDFTAHKPKGENVVGFNAGEGKEGGVA